MICGRNGTHFRPIVLKMNMTAWPNAIQRAARAHPPKKACMSGCTPFAAGYRSAPCGRTWVTALWCADRDGSRRIFMSALITTVG